MAGMKALGRVYNPVYMQATAVGVNMSECSGVGILAIALTTATTTLAFTAAKTFSGSYDNVVTSTGFVQPPVWYQQTAAGTAAWTSNTSSFSTATLTIGATAGYVSYVDFLGSYLADGYHYLKITPVNCDVVLLPYDLTVQRTPVNLAKISS